MHSFGPRLLIDIPFHRHNFITSPHSYGSLSYMHLYVAHWAKINVCSNYVKANFYKGVGCMGMS